MKAAIFYGPEDVRITTIPDPSDPGPDEVKLQVSRVGLCGTDAHHYKHPSRKPVRSGPIVMGHEVVGRVVQIGKDVEHIRVGDRVVPGAGMWCGECPSCLAGNINICDHYYLYGIQDHGGLAEFALFPAKMCQIVPQDCSDNAAAFAQPLAIALHALRRGAVSSAQTVAIFGIGSIGGLILAAMSAQKNTQQRIIAIDIDSSKLNTAMTLGASHVINAAQGGDPVVTILELTKGRGVDVAIDTSGLTGTTEQALTSVRKGGTVLQVGIPNEPSVIHLDQAVINEKVIITTNGHICTIDLPQALDLLTTTDIAEHLTYKIIPLKMLVQEGLIPLSEHRTSEKILVDVSAST